jgi:tRNA/rRNA methyltransferase
MPNEINQPVVILIRPQMGENIGAAARAMSNFGLSELRLIAPRDGWPNQRAFETASGGQPIIEAAQVYPDLPSAMHDISHAYATTARPRDMAKRVLLPGEAVREAVQHQSSGVRCALVFGPERTGIENEELMLCDTIVTIPTSVQNPSLNLGQAVIVMCYEWLQATLSAHTQGVITPLSPEIIPASKEEMNGMFTQLEQYLDAAEYFRTEQKKPIMWQNLKTMLLRGQWSTQELRSFRGMLRCLYEGRIHNPKHEEPDAHA